MTLTMLQSLLGWCALINFGVLMLWFVLYASAKEWLYRLHSRWFSVSKERYETVHLAAMAAYKLAIWMFNLAPFIALHLIR
jgi:hypothetical protein